LDGTSEVPDYDGRNSLIAGAFGLGTPIAKPVLDCFAPPYEAAQEVSHPDWLRLMPAQLS